MTLALMAVDRFYYRHSLDLDMLGINKVYQAYR